MLTSAPEYALMPYQVSVVSCENYSGG